MNFTEEELKLYTEYSTVLKGMIQDDIKDKYDLKISIFNIEIIKINSKTDVNYAFPNEDGLTIGETIKDVLKAAPTFDQFLNLKKREHRRKQLKKLGL